MTSSSPNSQQVEFYWTGNGKVDAGLATGRTVFKGFVLNGVCYEIGDYVQLYPEEPGSSPYLGRLTSCFLEQRGEVCEHQIELVWYERRAKFQPEVSSESGVEDKEVVLLEETDVNPLGCIAGKCAVFITGDAEEARRMASSLAPGVEWFFCRSVYRQASGLLEPLPQFVERLEASMEFSQANRACKRGAGAEGVADSDDVHKRIRMDGYSAAPMRRTGKLVSGRTCVECGATQTPQWREGPAGPKTLCNACGVRYVRAQQRANKARAAAAALARPSCSPQGRQARAAKAAAKAELLATTRLGTSRTEESGQRPLRQAALVAANRTAQYARTGVFPSGEEPPCVPTTAAPASASASPSAAASTSPSDSAPAEQQQNLQQRDTPCRGNGGGSNARNSGAAAAQGQQQQPQRGARESATAVTGAVPPSSGTSSNNSNTNSSGSNGKPAKPAPAPAAAASAAAAAAPTVPAPPEPAVSSVVSLCQRAEPPALTRASSSVVLDTAATGLLSPTGVPQAPAQPLQPLPQLLQPTVPPLPAPAALLTGTLSSLGLGAGQGLLSAAAAGGMLPLGPLPGLPAVGMVPCGDGPAGRSPPGAVASSGGSSSGGGATDAAAAALLSPVLRVCGAVCGAAGDSPAPAMPVSPPPAAPAPEQVQQVQVPRGAQMMVAAAAAAAAASAAPCAEEGPVQQQQQAEEEADAFAPLVEAGVGMGMGFGCGLIMGDEDDGLGMGGMGGMGMACGGLLMFDDGHAPLGMDMGVMGMELHAMDHMDTDVGMLYCQEVTPGEEAPGEEAPGEEAPAASSALADLPSIAATAAALCPPAAAADGADGGAGDVCELLGSLPALAARGALPCSAVHRVAALGHHVACAATEAAAAAAALAAAGAILDHHQEATGRAQEEAEATAARLEEALQGPGAAASASAAAGAGVGQFASFSATGGVLDVFGELPGGGGGVAGGCNGLIDLPCLGGMLGGGYGGLGAFGDVGLGGGMVGCGLDGVETLVAVHS